MFKFSRNHFAFSCVNFTKMKKKTPVPAEKLLLWFVFFFFPTQAEQRASSFISLKSTGKIWALCENFNAHSTLMAISSSAPSCTVINQIPFQLRDLQFLDLHPVQIQCDSPADFSKHSESCKESRIPGFSTLTAVQWYTMPLLPPCSTTFSPQHLILIFRVYLSPTKFSRLQSSYCVSWQ